MRASAVSLLRSVLLVLGAAIDLSEDTEIAAAPQAGKCSSMPASEGAKGGSFEALEASTGAGGGGGGK